MEIEYDLDDGVERTHVLAHVRFIKGSTDLNLPDITYDAPRVRLNDSVYFIRVGGTGKWRVFEHEYYGGNSQTLEPGAEYCVRPSREQRLMEGISSWKKV